MRYDGYAVTGGVSSTLTAERIAGTAFIMPEVAVYSREKLVWSAGFEPATSRSQGAHSTVELRPESFCRQRNGETFSNVVPPGIRQKVRLRSGLSPVQFGAARALAKTLGSRSWRIHVLTTLHASLSSSIHETKMPHRRFRDYCRARFPQRVKGRSGGGAVCSGSPVDGK